MRVAYCDIPILLNPAAGCKQQLPVGCVDHGVGKMLDYHKAQILLNATLSL